MCQLEVVHSLENGKSLANGLYADLFERFLVKAGQDIARDVMLCI